MSNKKDKKLHERIDELSIKYKLNDNCVKELRTLVKDAYIQGSNDCYKTFFKNDTIRHNY